MKVVTIVSLLLLTSAAFGELTKEDLRTIIKEENAALEKRLREYIDLKIENVNARIDALDKKIDGVEGKLNAKIDGVEGKLNARFDGLEKNVDARFDAVDKKLDWVWYMMIALIGLVTAAIAVPQIIVAYRDRGRQEMQTQQQELQTQIDQLHEKIEAMQQ